MHVPIYTYIKTGNGDTHVLESIVSIRNSDPRQSIIITSARFYDGRGKLVKEYLDKSIKLAPLENRTFIVKKRNSLVGDSAANFIITWKSEVPVYEPIIDAVMFGFTEENSFTFKSIGRPLTTHKEQ